MEHGAKTGSARSVASFTPKYSPALISLDKKIAQFMFELSCKIEAELPVLSNPEMIDELQPTVPDTSKMQQEEVKSEPQLEENEESQQDSEDEEVEQLSSGTLGSV